jgi:hypothetical protein
VDHLLEAVLLDQRIGELALREGRDLLRGDAKRTVAAVREAAGGSELAALALIAAEDETTHAVPLARQRLEAAVAPRVHEPEVQTFGTGLSHTAALTTALAEDERVRFARGMLDFANDRQESAHNRYEALLALQGIARYIPDDVRDELFGNVVALPKVGKRSPERASCSRGRQILCSDSGSRSARLPWHRPA